MSAWRTGRIRFGVFAFNRDLYPWESKAVELLKESGASCLFIEGKVKTAPRRAKISHSILDRLLGIRHRLSGSYEESSRRESYQPVMECAVERAGDGSFELRRAERLKIADRELEFILFFGIGELPAGLSSSARLGVWQFTRATALAESYPFVFDLVQGKDVVSFALEQIVGQGQHRRRLASGCFRARGESNRTVANQVFSQASRWPLQVLKHLLLNADLPRLEREDAVAQASFNPWALIISLAARDAFVRLSSTVAAYFVLETWTVGFMRMDLQHLLAGHRLPPVALLPRLEMGRYIADPFILSTAPELKILVEEFNDFGVGRISEVTVREPFGKAEVAVCVRLESQFHMSYPFLFQDEGIIYCLPECHQSGASLLYRYDEDKLVPVVELLSKARVTDGTVLHHDGLYWLFCGLEDDNDQRNLHIFYSKSLTENWVPHPLNPVKTDVRSARSGGSIIQHDGNLFRPAQDCSKSYGYGLSINRIDKLTTTRFEETVVVTMRPDAISASCKGLHTLSVAGDLIVIDAKFHLKGIEPILMRLIRRVRRMRGSAPGASESVSQSA